MSKIEEKIDKAAIISAANYDNPFDEPAYDKKFYYGFKTGAEWMLSHQWRSVEEELPEISKNVLIAYFSKIHETYFDIASRSEYGEWYSAVSEHGYPIEDPTHWMPIPPLPGERKEDEQ